MRQVFSRRNKRFIAIVMALMLMVGAIAPVSAVQFGEPDGDDHPHVGLLVFDVDGDAAGRFFHRR
jgi:hypothetical protein